MKNLGILLCAIVLAVTTSCSTEESVTKQEETKSTSLLQRSGSGAETEDDLDIAFDPSHSQWTKTAPRYNQITGELIDFGGPAIGYWTRRSNGTPVWVDNTCVNVTYYKQCEVFIPMFITTGNTDYKIAVKIIDGNRLRMILGSGLVLKNTNEVKASLIESGFSTLFADENANTYANGYSFSSKTELVGEIKNKFIERGMMNENQIILVNEGTYNYQFDAEHPNGYFDVPFVIE